MCENTKNTKVGLICPVASGLLICLFYTSIIDKIYEIFYSKCNKYLY